jgi:outer membrane autotransporter protein
VEQEYGFGGETESDGAAVSAYGNVRRAGFYVDLYASLGWLNFDTERTLLVGPGPTFAVVNGSTDASQMLAGATLGFDLLRHGKMTLGGVGGLYYHSLDIDGYTETGSIFAAIIPDRTIDSLKGAIGGEATFRLWSDESVVPFVRVLLNHEFMDDAFVSSAAFAGGPSVPFTVPGPTLGETWPSIGVGLSGNVSEWTSVYLRYQGDLGRDGQEQHSISAAARIGF